MTRNELIHELRTAELANGDPLRWVHLICEAAKMLEQGAELSCVGCVHYPQYPSHPMCDGCARSYSDHYEEKADERDV